MTDLTVARDHARRMAKKGENTELWAQIAAEIDDYLTRDLDPSAAHDDDMPLDFGVTP